MIQETKLVQLGGNAGMWICFDPTGSRIGLGASVSFVALLYWASITIDASLADAAAPNVPHSTVTSEVSSVPAAPAHHENDECRNVTTDNREGTFDNTSHLNYARIGEWWFSRIVTTFRYFIAHRNALLSCLCRYWTVSGQPWIRLSSFADSASNLSVRSSYLPTLSRNLREPHLLSTRKCLLPIVTSCTERHTWCTLFKVHSTRGLCLSCFVGLDNSLLAGRCSLECSLCYHQLRPCMHASLQAQAYQVYKGNRRGKRSKIK